MIGGLWMRVAAAGAVASLLIGGGWKVGYDRAEKKVGREASAIIMVARQERDQCREQVAKSNVAVAEQAVQQSEELKRDLERTNVARRRLESAAADLGRLQRENLELANLAKEYLRNANDACAGAVMPDDFGRMLEQLANPGQYGDGGVPPGPAPNRPVVPQPEAGVSRQ